nr:retrovirus-related Pol polyprotein from transposon TNT 1-94 [Tanacetum cinerariifolium]
MNQFCEQKEIKREISVARTLQQNKVAERKNRTLIEAARTILANLMLPTTFWAEAVNTACYVQNKVLVIKPHNKTPYELLHGRTPSLSFIRPFGCPVPILNTLDPLGKFDGKADKGLFIGYSMNSKAFRVFNSRTRIVEETLHITFLENKPNVVMSGPTWIFDIDILIKSMNYKPVVVGKQSNGSVGKARVKTVPNKDYILLPLWTQDPLFSSSSKDSPGDSCKPSGEKEKKDVKGLGNKDNEVLSTEGPRVSQEKDSNVNSTNNINTVSSTTNATGIKDIVYGCADDLNMLNLEKIVYSDKDEGVVARIEAIKLFLAYTSFKDFVLYQMDLKSAFLYGRIEKEVYVCQPLLFEDPEFPDRVYKVEKALYGLHQAPRDWYETLSTYLFDNEFHIGLQVTQKDDGIFIRQDKYVDEILKKFSFSTVKIASTHMETSKPLLKDENAEDVDVHLYRSMIGSLMYLISSRPDIMFADSPFNLEAYTDSDYASASLDRKSTIGDETVNEERRDIVDRATITDSSLEAEQECGTINRTQSTTIPNEPIPQGTSLGPLGFGNLKVKEESQERRLFKVRIESSAEKSLGDQDDASNQGRNDQDEEISIVHEDAETQGRYGHDIEVNTASTSITTASINLTAAEPVTTVSASVTTTSVSVSTVEPSTPPITTTLIEDEDRIIPKTLMKMRSEPEKPVKVKGKDQIALDEEVARRLEDQMQAEFKEEERVARQREEETSGSSELAKEPRDKEADELSQEKLQQMMIIVLVYGMNVEALQTKYLIIDWEIYTEGTRKDDLVMMWSLVKEKFNSTEPTNDKEREIWVELKRLFELDTDDEEGNKHLHAGREGVSNVKRNSYIDADDIRPIFEKHFNSNVAFLLKTKEQMDEKDSRALKRLSESQEEKATKKQKVDEEVEELRKHLMIVPNEEDDVYTEATPLARKIITFTTTQLILLVERRYPLTRFTLDQMVNNVRLEVEEDSEVSLEMLSFGVDAAKDFKENMLSDYCCQAKLMMLINAAKSN